MGKRVFSLLCIFFLFGFCGFTFANPHIPAPPSTPTDYGVIPELYEKSKAKGPDKVVTGNGFNEVNQVGDYDFGYKIDNLNRNSDGTYTNNGNSITITTTEFKGGDVIKFNWSSTLPLNLVLVKSGTWYFAYFYHDGCYGDKGLYAPNNKGIGHVSFGWGMPEIDIQDPLNNDIQCSTGSYDFGYIPVNESSPVITFDIQNIGTSDLNLTGSPYLIEISGVDASMFNVNQSSTSTPLTPGSSTTFSIVFNPTSEGVKYATILIANNDKTENPYTFTITGRTFLFSSSKLITPAQGGTITWSNVGDLPGGSLVIPPGAINSEELVTVTAKNSDKDWDEHAVVYYLEPAGLIFNIPAQLTIGYRESWVNAMNIVESELLVFHKSQPRPNYCEEYSEETIVPINYNFASNQFTVEINHFSIINMIRAATWDRFFKGNKFIDSSEKIIKQSDVFWEQNETKNILIIHGLLSSASEFIDFGKDIENINNFTVRYFDYNSTKSVVDNAEDLKNRINQYAKPGFKFNIIAHSMGGLVARYAVERFGLNTKVGKVITLGTPHEGAVLASNITGLLDYYSIPFPELQCLKFPGVIDLIPHSQMLQDLNAGENGPCYVVWANNDSIVMYLSELGLTINLDKPDSMEVTTSGGIAGHGELYTDAKSKGVINKIEEWLSGSTIQEWASEIDEYNIIGITHDTQNTWVATTKSGGWGPSFIHKLGSDGSVITKYDITSTNRYINGLASQYIGQLYSFDQLRDYLIEHSTTVTSYVNKISQTSSGLANGPRTLTFGQSHLWAISNPGENELHKIDPSTLKVVKTYNRTAVPDLTGIAWEDSQLWGLGPNGEFYKLTLGSNDVTVSDSYSISGFPSTTSQLAYNGHVFLVASNNCIYKVRKPDTSNVILLSDDFEDGDTSDWTLFSSAKINVSSTYKKSGQYGGHFRNSIVNAYEGPGKFAPAYKIFGQQKNDIVIEFDAMSDGGGGHYNWRYIGFSDVEVKIDPNDPRGRIDNSTHVVGGICYLDNTYGVISSESEWCLGGYYTNSSVQFAPFKWNHFRFEVNIQNNSFTLYIDNNKVGTYQFYRQVEQISIVSIGSEYENLYIDNLVVKKQ